MNGMSIGRRRLLLAMAATGAAGTCGLFNRAALARLALAGTQATPRLKIIFFITPDGLGVDEFQNQQGEWNGKGIWHPKSTFDISKDFDTSEFQLNEVSELLEPYREQSVYLRGGISNFSAGNGAFGGHNGYTTILRDQAASMTSIDNLIVEHFHSSDPGKPLLYSGPHTQVSNSWYVSYLGGNMLKPQANPLVLYEEVFGRSRAGVGAIRPLSARVFDPVLADIRAVREQVRGYEREKFDTHLDAVEKLQADLEHGGATPPAECSPVPPDIAGLSMTGVDDRVTVTDRHMDVTATALACGMRRVATVQLSASTETLNFPDIDSKRNPHDLAHWGLFTNDASSRDEWLASRRWYVQRLVYLLEQLGKHADPDTPSDSLADHTLVILTSEMSDGFKEHCMDMPLVFIGGKGTPLITKEGGRYLSVATQGEVTWYAGRPVKGLGTQRVWSSLARAVGTTVPYIGNNELVPNLFRMA